MITYLAEIDRSNLVGKVKAQGRGRYDRRRNYKPDNFMGTDVSQLFSNDVLVCPVPIGSYVTTVAFQGVLLRLKELLEQAPKHNLTLQMVIKAISRAIDSSDILVDCTCPDFRYRFAYWATRYGYKYGKPETRPAKITNPDDKIGSMCKHLTALLANKRWVVKVASILNDYIKTHPDEARQAMGLSEDELVINPLAYRAGKQGYYARLFDYYADQEKQRDRENNPDEQSGQNNSETNTTSIDNSPEDSDEEELEIDDSNTDNEEDN